MKSLLIVVHSKGRCLSLFYLTPFIFISPVCFSLYFSYVSVCFTFPSLSLSHLLSHSDSLSRYLSVSFFLSLLYHSLPVCVSCVNTYINISLSFSVSWSLYLSLSRTSYLSQAIYFYLFSFMSCLSIYFSLSLLCVSLALCIVLSPPSPPSIISLSYKHIYINLRLCLSVALCLFFSTFLCQYYLDINKKKRHIKITWNADIVLNSNLPWLIICHNDTFQSFKRSFVHRTYFAWTLSCSRWTEFTFDEWTKSK